MNTIEIRYFLKKHKKTKKYFDDVYPADYLLKTRIKKNATKIIIANFSPSNSIGTHWIAIRVSPTSIEFFDTAGDRSLRENPYFQAFVEKNKRPKIVYNTRVIQGNSDLCGEYTILYTLFRSTGHSFVRFLREFTFKKKELNDRKALYLFSRNFLIVKKV